MYVSCIFISTFAREASKYIISSALIMRKPINVSLNDDKDYALTYVVKIDLLWYQKIMLFNDTQETKFQWIKKPEVKLFLSSCYFLNVGDLAPRVVHLCSKCICHFTHKCCVVTCELLELRKKGKERRCVQCEGGPLAILLSHSCRENSGGCFLFVLVAQIERIQLQAEKYNHLGRTNKSRGLNR